jgi:2-oxoglutarate dehydrogenase E1 component
MLRLAQSFSPLESLTAGKFAPILPDEGGAGARRLVLCSGKLYYDLAAAKAKKSSPAAIARLEQLAPLAESEIASLAARSVESIVWAQEEPENMGAWNFLRPRLAKIFPGFEIELASRPASSSPATGTFSVFQREQEEIVRKALG